MKKATAVSIGLIVLGIIFECIHLSTDIRFFKIKFWLLGIISIIAGFAGLKWYAIIPLLERRASVLGRFKRNTRKK